MHMYLIPCSEPRKTTLFVLLKPSPGLYLLLNKSLGERRGTEVWKIQMSTEEPRITKINNPNPNLNKILFQKKQPNHDYSNLPLVISKGSEQASEPSVLHIGQQARAEERMTWQSQSKYNCIYRHICAYIEVGIRVGRFRFRTFGLSDFRTF